MKNITIIEDDKALNDGIMLALTGGEYSFTQLHKLGDFNKEKATDLIILDVNLPDGNGFDFLRDFRQMSDVPVIMLTANDLETDEVMGLTLGADDYITKPFSLMVLRARIDKVLKKAKTSDVYRDDLYIFDYGRMEFFVNSNLVDLSKTEQKLLKLLTENAGRTLTRDYLVDAIWTDGAEYVDENALSVTINRLRGKLSVENEDVPIHTVYGKGYVWKREK
ncbi:MAG: response regulator transcription factor [Lachnospiraceae bacterium]|nr:response regulator transcription factor [Lachnospiraceae bacterium]